jgi:hypothetical protein
VLKESVLQGLASAAILSALKAKIGKDAVQQDLGSLSPATLVQVLHATHAPHQQAPPIKAVRSGTYYYR